MLAWKVLHTFVRQHAMVINETPGSVMMEERNKRETAAGTVTAPDSVQMISDTADVPCLLSYVGRDGGTGSVPMLSE